MTRACRVLCPEASRGRYLIISPVNDEPAFKRRLPRASNFSARGPTSHGGVKRGTPMGTLREKFD